jgi:hypothetical protein
MISLQARLFDFPLGSYRWYYFRDVPHNLIEEKAGQRLRNFLK